MISDKESCGESYSSSSLGSRVSWRFCSFCGGETSERSGGVCPLSVAALQPISNLLLASSYVATRRLAS